MGNLQLPPGSVFANRFEIECCAGSGGMGAVYRARDRYSGDLVALKLLHENRGGNDEAERFAREAQLLAELRHPGIVSHVAHGQNPDGQRFLAMEWLDGADLAHRLLRGPLPIGQCVALLVRISGALAIAHERGVIHRDLKPANLFLVGGEVDNAKILDFGIARRVVPPHALTRTGMVVGTPEYMAPEQARGARDLTPAADLFALGCILYECLVGHPPFVADHVAAVLVRILFEEPPSIDERRTGVPAVLRDILGRLLAKDPGLRPVSALALRNELADLGEISEPALAPTMASAKPPSVNFAEHEQSLFSVVLAAPRELEAGLDTTFRPDDFLKEAERQSLLGALSELSFAADYLANGALVVTVPPTGSATDQVTRAARAALLIKERWPAAVISLATGRGIIRGRTAVGEVVEAAARSLQSGSLAVNDQALSGVFVDMVSAKLLESRFALMPQPMGALLIGEQKDEDATRLLLGKPTSCVGREAELATFDALLQSCIEESEARVVIVTAPPGTGKSRLRHEFLRRLAPREASLMLLLGRGDMMSAGAPYQILRQAVLRLCGLSGSEPSETQRTALSARIGTWVPQAERRRIVEFVGEIAGVAFPDDGTGRLIAAREDPRIMRLQVRRAFVEWLGAECRNAPGIVVLDDLQWGDALSVDLVDEALRELRSEPLFIIALARPELREIFPKLWPGNRGQDIELKGLGKKACERLIKQVLTKQLTAEGVERIVEQSAGNALLLEELIRAAAGGTASEQPETVLAMLQARLGRFATGPRKAVLAAAIFGQIFWRGAIAAILGIQKHEPEIDNWMEALVEAEVIGRHSESRLADECEYGFRHALLREAAYGLLIESDQRMGHHRAGAFLQAAGERDPALIAEHYELGGDKESAAILFCTAVERAVENRAHDIALRWVERGLRCGAQGELKGKLLALASVANLDHLGRFDKSYEAACGAMELVKPGSWSWERAIFSSVVAAISGPPEWQARIPILLGQLLACEPEVEADGARAETLGYFTAILSLVAPQDQVRVLLRALTQICERSEQRNPTIIRHLLSAQGYYDRYFSPAPWRVLQTGLATLKLLEQVGDRRNQILIMVFNIGMAWWELGDQSKAIQMLGSCQDAAKQDVEFIPQLQANLKLHSILVRQTNHDVAEQVKRHLAELPDRLMTHSLFGGHARDTNARLLLQQGRLVEAEAEARAAWQLLRSAPNYEPNVQAPLIHALIGQEKFAEAVAVAQDALEIIQYFGGIGHAEVELRLAISEAFHAAKNFARANTELSETLRQMTLRADDITDPFWKNSYLTRNPYCVRAQQLGQEWGIGMVAP